MFRRSKIAHLRTTLHVDGRFEQSRQKAPRAQVRSMTLSLYRVIQNLPMTDIISKYRCQCYGFSFLLFYRLEVTHLQGHNYEQIDFSKPLAMQSEPLNWMKILEHSLKKSLEKSLGSAISSYSLSEI